MDGDLEKDLGVIKIEVAFETMGLPESSKRRNRCKGVSDQVPSPRTIIPTLDTSILTNATGKSNKMKTKKLKNWIWQYGGHW